MRGIITAMINLLIYARQLNRLIEGGQSRVNFQRDF